MTEGQLFSLATKCKPPAEPHIFGQPVRVMPHDSPTGCEQREWKCQRCRVVRITVLPRGQDARRMYRIGDGEQFEYSCEPPCLQAGEMPAELTDRGCRP